MTPPSLQRTVSYVAPQMAKTGLCVADWSFADPQKNVNDFSFSQLTVGGGLVTYVFEGKSHFDVATRGLDGERKTPGLQLQLSKVAEAELECMIACVQHEMLENATKFGMNADDVQELFKSPMSKNGTFPANLRVKMSGTRYWADGALTNAPDSHAGRKWQAKVHFKSIWIAPNAWGITCAALDLQEMRTEVECPF
jgi:hypothetical protein